MTTPRHAALPALALLALATLHAAAALTDAPHPRLLWPRDGEAAVRQRLAADPLAKALADRALAAARGILDQRTCRYEIPDGKRLLGESRRALHNITHTAWAWRMTGEAPFRERTLAELDAACALKDWNPRHFLDTAEMALAVAIGYDWLFDTLDPARRQRCEDALVAKALRPAAGVYQSKGWWSRPSNNWSQVCGSGIALAAAAVCERDPALCQGLFDRGLALVADCTRFYQPDGAYPEGPGYWHYGSNYHVFLLAACEPLGVAAEVPPVWRRSGEFMLHVVGPTRIPFNFADAGAGRDEPSPAQSWIASRFRDPGQAHAVRERLQRALDAGGNRGSHGTGRHFPLHLLWLPAAPDAAANLPLAARFDGQQPLAMFRTAWSDAAAFLAIKGGTALASHGHMDAGSLVYDAAGIRWIHDLGSDDYNMPGYFGGKRWDYFRLTNRSHNTLVIGDRLQHPHRSPATILPPETPADPAATTATVALDLTPAYQDQARQVRRRASFDHQTGAVAIEDHLVAPAGDVRWAVVTRAKVAINGRHATLEQSGKRLAVTRADDCGGPWTVADATPPTAREHQNRGFRILSFTAPAAPELLLRVEWKPE